MQPTSSITTRCPSCGLQRGQGYLFTAVLQTTPLYRCGVCHGLMTAAVDVPTTPASTACPCCGFDPAHRVLLDHADKRTAYGRCRVCGRDAVLETDTVIDEVDYHPAPEGEDRCIRGDVLMQQLRGEQVTPPRERHDLVLPTLTWWQRAARWLNGWWTSCERTQQCSSTPIFACFRRSCRKRTATSR